MILGITKDYEEDKVVLINKIIVHLSNLIKMKTALELKIEIDFRLIRLNHVNLGSK